MDSSPHLKRSLEISIENTEVQKKIKMEDDKVIAPVSEKRDVFIQLLSLKGTTPIHFFAYNF
jgi:hypothetical protein